MCTASVCDVDGSGAITVTDGVSVLRKAAGITITENCPGAVGQPATVLAEIQPLLKYGVGFANGTPVSSCANAPDGEIEVEVDDDLGTTTTSFDLCQVDDITLDGDIIVESSLITFSFFDADSLAADDIADYDGELTLGNSGGGRSLDGTLDVDTESAGPTTMAFEGVIVVAGSLTGGRVTLDLSDSDLADSFTSLELSFDGSGVAIGVATQVNGGTTSFRFDIATGVLS